MDEQDKNGTPSHSEKQPSAEPENPLTVGEANSSEPPTLPVARIGTPLESASPPPAKLPEPAPPVSPSIRLEKKHPLAIRWMHWVNFPVLFTMIWSGLLIY